MDRRPRIAARGVRLQTLKGDDFETLRTAEFTVLAGRWRTRGATPSVRHYEDVVSAGVHTQVLLLGSRGDLAHDELLGWCQLYNVELDNGVGSIGAARFAAQRDPRFSAGLVIFVQYVFDTCPLRKVYFDLPAYNEPAFTLPAHDMMVEEGRLRDRVFHAGEFVDVAIWSLSREAWDASGTAELVMGS